MKSVLTYGCNIYLGLKEGYNGAQHSINEVREFLQEYCDRISFAFSLTETEFIYKDGNELGCIIGIINYPRFPKSNEELKNIAIIVGQLLLEKFIQQRLSIVCSDETIMLEKDED